MAIGAGTAGTILQPLTTDTDAAATIQQPIPQQLVLVLLVFYNHH